MAPSGGKANWALMNRVTWRPSACPRAPSYMTQALVPSVIAVPKVQLGYWDHAKFWQGLGLGLGGCPNGATAIMLFRDPWTFPLTWGVALPCFWCAMLDCSSIVAFSQNDQTRSMYLTRRFFLTRLKTLYCYHHEIILDITIGKIQLEQFPWHCATMLRHYNNG